MDVARMFMLGVRLEQQAAECYKKLGRLAAPDGVVAQDLEKLARDEVVHANLLKAGENYAADDPGLFEAANLTEADLTACLGLAEKLGRELDGQALSLTAGLAVMRDLETLMERAHLATLVKVKDEPLKKLFEALSQGDIKHRERLDKVLATLRVEPAS